MIVFILLTASQNYIAASGHALDLWPRVAFSKLLKRSFPFLTSPVSILRKGNIPPLTFASFPSGALWQLSTQSPQKRTSEYIVWRLGVSLACSFL